MPSSKELAENKKNSLPDNKQIKVWHLAEGLHGRPQEDFNKLTKMYKNYIFNEETKKFFTEQCDCGNFFKCKYNMNGGKDD